MRLAEFRRAARGELKIPSAGSWLSPQQVARAARAGPAGTRVPWCGPGCKLDPRGARLASFCLSDPGVSRKHTHLLGVPPIHGGLTSDPARRKVFQLEAAHGRGRGNAPARAGPVPIQCVRGVARGRGARRRTAELPARPATPSPASSPRRPQHAPSGP